MLTFYNIYRRLTLLARCVEHVEHSANSTPFQNRQCSHFPESSAEGFLHAAGQGFNSGQTLRFQEGVSTRQSVQGGVQGLASDRGDRSDLHSAQSSSGLLANPGLPSETGTQSYLTIM